VGKFDIDLRSQNQEHERVSDAVHLEVALGHILENSFDFAFSEGMASRRMLSRRVRFDSFANHSLSVCSDSVVGPRTTVSSANLNSAPPNGRLLASKPTATDKTSG
jgi:hypothetical protein